MNYLTFGQVRAELIADYRNSEWPFAIDYTPFLQPGLPDDALPDPYHLHLVEISEIVRTILDGMMTVGTMAAISSLTTFATPFSLSIAAVFVTLGVCTGGIGRINNSFSKLFIADQSKIAFLNHKGKILYQCDWLLRSAALNGAIYLSSGCFPEMASFCTHFILNLEFFSLSHHAAHLATRQFKQYCSIPERQTQ